MAIERERKFLVDPTKLPEGFFSDSVVKAIQSGYFTKGPIAIRVTQREGGKSKICFKGPGTEERAEFEYIIPNEDADQLLELAPTHLTKVRYDYKGWEIDQFGFAFAGQDPLWIAEWEEHEGKEALPFILPDWIIREVTQDERFSNMNLSWQFGSKFV